MAEVNYKAMWKNCEQLPREFETGILKFCRPILRRIRRKPPLESMAVDADAKFHPATQTGVPQQAMHWQRVQQFIAENDAENTTLRQITP